MKSNIICCCIFLFGIIGGCKSAYNDKSMPDNPKVASSAQQLLQNAFEAHGGAKCETSHYKFVFRGKEYTFKNEGPLYRYTASSKKDGKIVEDVLDNNGLKRTIDGTVQQLTNKQSVAYSGAVNSVIYFATLPHKLFDPAVNLTDMGTGVVKGKNYALMGVTFDQEGGGRDFDDHYIYWINAENKRIDYLAYDYRVNNGGVRFRSAYNTRIVDGLLFQDYINYKAPVGTALSDLPQLYEEDKLEKLSVILTEDVINLK